MIKYEKHYKIRVNVNNIKHTKLFIYSSWRSSSTTGSFPSI